MLPLRALKAQPMAINPIPTTEKPIAYSEYFKTPNNIRAIPSKVIINDPQAKMVFLFITLQFTVPSSFSLQLVHLYLFEK